MRNFQTIKLSPFLKDIVLTTITSIFVTVSMIFVTRFLAKGLGPDMFGAYSLARRLVSFVIPFSTLSMGVALTRYVAMSTDQEKRNGYLVSTTIVVFCFSLILSGVGYLGGKSLTILIFHDLKFLVLFYSSLFMIAGFGLFTILYSYYRGIQRMDLANLLQICIVAVFPLIISYTFAQQGDAALIVFLMGLCTFVTIFPLMISLKRVKGTKPDQLKPYASDLLRYGIPRTPGGIAFVGIVAIGPFLAPYFGTLSDAGYLVVGQSVFRVLEGAVVAFGLVALPKVSQILSDGRTVFLRDRISDILAMIIHMSVFIIIQLFIWSKEIVLIWLGPEYSEAVPIIRIFLVSLCPYLGYVMLRSIVDAVEEKAINTLNLFVAFGITVVLSLLLGCSGLGVLGLAVGITVGLISLGISTTYFLVRRYKVTFENMNLVLVLFVNCVFAGITIFAKKHLVMHFNDMGVLIFIFTTGTSLFVFYMWLLYNKKTQWIMELKSRVF